MIKQGANRIREPYREIKKFLIDRDIDQQTFGEVIGKNPSDINKRLNGTGADFSLSEARKLVDEFKIPFEYFFEPNVPISEREPTAS